MPVEERERRPELTFGASLEDDSRSVNGGNPRTRRRAAL